MCSGIAVHWREFPDSLIAREQLNDRVVTRNGSDTKEVRFLYRDPRPQLPALVDNELLLVEWGNRDNKQSRLPRTGWCRTESLEAGTWRHLRPREVVIPACLGLEKGVWFQIREGIRAILVLDEAGGQHAYMLTEQASHYYQVMTRHNRMPCFVDQQI